MRIYTNVFDLARICPRRFWVAPFSDFKIGVKITEKGAPSAKDFVVKAGQTELIPDDDKVDGFTTYAIKSADTGSVEYAIEVAGLSEKLKLVQITTDSTVFEVGGGGGDVPADVATRSWVNSQISDFVDEDALSAYAEKTDLTAYAKTDSLSAYATTDSLTAYAEKDDLTAFYEKSETSSATEIGTALAGKQPSGDYLTAETEPAFAAMSADIVVDGDLSAYYAKSETSSAAEIGTALEGKQPAGNYLTAETEPAFAAMSADIVVDGDLTAYYAKSETSSAAELSVEFNAVSDRADSAYGLADDVQQQLPMKIDHMPGGTAPEVTNIETYYESEYAQLSVDDPAWEPDPETMYVILPDQA